MNSNDIRRRLGMLGQNENYISYFLLLVTVIFLCILLFPMKVSGSSETEVTSREAYHELEMVFLDVLDMRLTNYGYAGSGITLNSIVDLDGSRTYYVQIHHQRITGDDTAEWEALCAQLSDVAFPADRCNILFELVP